MTPSNENKMKNEDISFPCLPPSHPNFLEARVTH